MKNGMKKLIASTVLAGLLVLSSTSFAAYDPIYRQESAISTYADGVTHQNIRTFTNEGWINLNVMRIDLTKNVSLTALTDEYLTNRDTLTNIVKKNDLGGNIVAAINTDFFGASTLGNVANNGKLISTSVGIDEFASFNVATSGMPFVAYINSPNNAITNGTSTFTLDYINKPYLTENRLILFDHNWSKQSYGGSIEADVVEMYVKDGYIHEIRTNGAPFELSENAYVIAAVGTRKAEITQKLRVGDAITVNYDVNFRFMDLSVGGGAQLVKDGKVVTEFSQNINGKHPRTGLGISKDRKEVILVTVDGRTNSYRGVTQTELANILISLGAYEGINFDGGGSTQMVAKSPWTTQLSTLNYPSEQSERRIFTALGVEKILVEAPELNHIQIEMKQTNIFENTTVPVTVSAIDTNYNAMSIDPSAVKWSVSGIEGVFENGNFIAKSSGKGIITAEYFGKTATKQISVNRDAVKLLVSPA
ncbi:MAG: phosphodiester glycosidase family protein, partial [Bacillota bacterium]|nr:phosphodiester glycosidase family protein [Bacillota bacterium]